ncbi:MAG: hypothetical protein RL243_439 [Actinomycetota bacterium]|jgi:hypothetical protein
MASQTNPVARALSLYRVASLITGTLLVAISILFALRLSASEELWLAGPHGLLSLEHFTTDAMGERQGLPKVGFDLTVAVLIVHGWFYMLYLYSDYKLWSLMRWSFMRFLIIAAGGVVPLLSFFTERHFHKIALAQASTDASQTSTPSEA